MSKQILIQKKSAGGDKFYFILRDSDYSELKKSGIQDAMFMYNTFSHINDKNFDSLSQQLQCLENDTISNPNKAFERILIEIDYSNNNNIFFHLDEKLNKPRLTEIFQKCLAEEDFKKIIDFIFNKN